jgi:tetratricopeptide (TPR) repeat protein
MRPTRHVTAVLLLAAFGAVGCSKGGDTARTKAEPTGTAQAKPVTKSSEPLKAAAQPTITEPATFADGKAAYDAKKYSDATTIFASYTERRPDNAWGHYMLGLSAWKSGDPARAESAFEKALGIDPNHVKSYVNLGRVLIDLKRSDEALVKLERAVDIDPDSGEVRRLLGRTYHAQGKIDEAMDAYRHVIELNEFDAWSMNNLGLLLLEKQRADEALPLFAKAVELRKDVPAFHNNLGMALEHTGRFKDAATAYGGALTADHGYDKAKQNLARVELVKENVVPTEIAADATTASK